MKKLLFIGTVLLFTFVLGGNNVFADSLNPEDTVKKAYDALLKGDSKEYSNYVIDKRFNSEEEAISFYGEDYKHDPMKSYEILNEEKQDDGSYEFTIKREHESGGTFKITIIVKKINDSWKMYISDDDDDAEGKDENSNFEVLKDRDTDKLFSKSVQSDNSIQAGMVLRSFNVTVTNYKDTSTFKLPTRGLILYVSKQTLNNPNSLMTYSIRAMYSDGTRSIGSKKLAGNRTNYTASLGLSDLPSSGYLRVSGSGKSIGALEY